MRAERAEAELAALQRSHRERIVHGAHEHACDLEVLRRAHAAERERLIGQNEKLREQLAHKRHGIHSAASRIDALKSRIGTLIAERDEAQASTRGAPRRAVREAQASAMSARPRPLRPLRAPPLERAPILAQCRSSAPRTACSASSRLFPARCPTRRQTPTSQRPRRAPSWPRQTARRLPTRRVQRARRRPGRSASRCPARTPVAACAARATRSRRTRVSLRSSRDSARAARGGSTRRPLRAAERAATGGAACDSYYQQPLCDHVRTSGRRPPGTRAPGSALRLAGSRAPSRGARASRAHGSAVVPVAAAGSGSS